ncbi:hypothetical protein Q4524_02180 [Alteromonas stellipolaris]|uniref:hypothetical protein n=1 Tax=Alteromonas stellipolaris TaxID=233316 RepID=UPI0026E2915E|nr:hypothetical protein [Alteromonas stellipolaris]MDO6537379.1 hypothetical protein [Alteromonas stellipolaris]
MVIFESEQDIVKHLDVHDQIVSECLDGKLDFRSFCERYNNFYDFCALDGHESDVQEAALLSKYEHRILLHKRIRDEILYKVCSEEDANKSSFIESGRFGPRVALDKLKMIGQLNA